MSFLSNIGHWFVNPIAGSIDLLHDATKGPSVPNVPTGPSGGVAGPNYLGGLPQYLPRSSLNRYLPANANVANPQALYTFNPGASMLPGQTQDQMNQDMTKIYANMRPQQGTTYSPQLLAQLLMKK